MLASRPTAGGFVDHPNSLWVDPTQTFMDQGFRTLVIAEMRR